MSLFKSLTTTFLFRVIVIASSMTTGIILARTLGPEGRGEWALILLNVILLTLIANFGTPEASIYFIGQKKFNEQDVILTLTSYSFIIAVVIVLVNFLLYKLHLNILLNDFEANVVYLTSANVVPQALNTQMRHFLLGKKEVVAYNLLVTYEALMFTIAVALLTFLSIISVSNVLAAYLIVNGFSLIIHLHSVSNFVRWTAIISSFKIHIVRACLKNGSTYFFTGMGGFWSHRVNYLFLELYHSSADIGFYSVALAIPNLIANIPNQISLVLYPYISAIKEKGRAIELTSVILKVSVVLILILFLPILFQGDKIIVMIYGEEYGGLFVPLLILFAAMALDGVGSLLFNHFAGQGKPIFGSYKFLISISMLILGGFLLVPQYGVEGAALSKMISAACATMFIVYLFSREHGIKNIILIRANDLQILKKILKQEI